MIEKERLEELIEQGVTVYSADTKLYGLVKWLELENQLKRLEFNENGDVKLFIIDNGWWHWFNLKDLYEDLEDVKWLKEFGCIERTEKLYLPSFKEVYKDLAECTGEFVIAETSGFTLSIEKSLVDQILLRTQLEKYNWNFNKENYALVCRKAKELFLLGNN